MMNQSNQPISSRALSIGYWIAGHRPLLHRLLISFFVVIAVLSMGIFVRQTIIWLGHIEETRLLWETISQTGVDYSAIQRPLPITIVKSKAIARDAQTVDLFVLVKNENTIWAATELRYELSLGSSSIGSEDITLAPGEERYIIKSSLPFSGGTPPAVKITQTTITWKKFADRSRLPDDNWEFQNPHYGWVQSSDETIPFKTELNFTLKNISVYGFREPEVVILMTDEGGEVQAIGHIILDAMQSQESRLLTFRWPERLESRLTPVISMNVDHLTEHRIIRTLD